MSAATATRIAVVSGSSGFLGASLCAHLAERGFTVRALLRDPTAPHPELGDAERYACTLPDQVDEEAFRGAQVFVHGAWDTRFRSPSQAWAVNVEGSRRLFRACRKRGVRRIIFVSSLSAHEGAASTHGRTKLEVEALLDPTRDLAIRLGHVVGHGGIFWRTAQSIAVLPFIPLFYGGRQLVQTVAIADVCEGIRLAIEKDLTGTLTLAEIEPVTLREFYGAIAIALGKRPRFVPLPGGIVLLALRVAEWLAFTLPLSSDNLLGLKRLQAFECADDAQRLGLTPRTMRESLAQVEWKKLARD